MMETNYAVHPGAFVEEWLEENNCDASLLVVESGRTEDQIRRLLHSAYFDDGLPAVLHRITNIPVSFWQRSWALYQADRERLRGLVRHVYTVEELDSEELFDVVGVLPHGGPVRVPSSRIDGVNYWLEPGCEQEYNSTEFFNTVHAVHSEPEFTVLDLPTSAFPRTCDCRAD